jgi:hypothetical protein
MAAAASLLCARKGPVARAQDHHNSGDGNNKDDKAKDSSDNNHTCASICFIDN